MKKKSYLITTLAFVTMMVIFGFTDKSQSNGGILTMRVSECISALGDNSITIVYEDGKVEKVELKRLRVRDLSKNLVVINENLNKIKSKGYRLNSTSQGGGMNSFILTTYTFEKE